MEGICESIRLANEGRSRERREMQDEESNQAIQDVLLRLGERATETH